MTTEIDVEAKVATIREALDELRGTGVLDGFIIIELDELLDRLVETERDYLISPLRGERG